MVNNDLKKFIDDNKNTFIEYFNKLSKLKEDFYKAVDGFNNNELFEDIRRKGTGTGQYSGIIYWKKLTLKEKITNENYEDVIGLHIMPYRITKDTVEKAVKKDSNKHPFNKEILKNSDFCDYDTGSANFHKLPNNEYQVVLVITKKDKDGKPIKDKDGNLISLIGTGWIDEAINENENIVERLKKIKDNYYFPPITDPDAYDEKIKNRGIKKDSPEFIAFLVKEALDKIIAAEDTDK